MSGVIIPVSFLALQSFDLGYLVFQVPCFPFAINLLFLIDDLKDSTDEWLNEDLFNEVFLFEACFLWLNDEV